MKHLALLGSTGSIGTQALQVVREQKEHFEVELLVAGSNADLLIAQAKEFSPNAVVIGDQSKYARCVMPCSRWTSKFSPGPRASSKR